MDDEIADEFDEMIANMPKERVLVALARALKSCNIGYEWNEEGGIDIEEQNFDELEQNEEFVDAFEFQLKLMCMSDIMRTLEEEGIVVSSVRDDGEIVYKLADGVELP